MKSDHIHFGIELKFLMNRTGGSGMYMNREFIIFYPGINQIQDEMFLRCKMHLKRKKTRAHIVRNYVESLESNTFSHLLHLFIFIYSL